MSYHDLLVYSVVVSTYRLHGFKFIIVAYAIHFQDLDDYDAPQATFSLLSVSYHELLGNIVLLFPLKFYTVSNSE